MIALSKKLFYAIEAVLYIAYNTASEPASGKDIAARQGMPPRYLEQMLQRLVHGGILRGVRGPRGGYLLAREKRRITLADICSALDEEEVIPTSTPLGNQVVAPIIRTLQSSLMSQLDTTTLAELQEQAAKLSIRKADPIRNDFTI